MSSCTGYISVRTAGEIFVVCRVEMWWYEVRVS
jgi:hypothetical protein